MTNKEWLFSLNDAELAKVLGGFDCTICIYHNDSSAPCGERDCDKGIEMWLRKEHSGEPRFATLLRNNEVYPIEVIHYATKQVTLAEKPKVSNTVSFSLVEFDFSNMSQTEIANFKSRIK